jgi:two-component system, cell cycle response regulator DivK
MSKVLVVEDNDLNLKLFHDLLMMKKHQVITSKEGKDAFNLAKTELPDLILMDIQLNGISGLDIIKALKQEVATSNIPIIAITAFAMKHDEMKIMQSGCDMYLSKPVSMGNFFEAVAMYLK